MHSGSVILYYYFQQINSDTNNVHMQGDISRFISAIFGIIQRVHYIIFGNDKRISYANKLCIHTGAVVSLKPKD